MGYGEWIFVVVKSGVNVSEEEKKPVQCLSVSEIKCVDEMFFLLQICFWTEKYF